MGLAFVAWLIPIRSIFPPDALHMADWGDGAQSMIGQRYFLAEPWGWPLLKSSRIDWPNGLNVALTDSIPLAMLPLKLFAALLPRGFTLQAGWIAIVWTLQPVAAVYALRSAGVRSLPAALAAAVLSLSMPTLLLRYGQMSLCSHAAILFAIGLYFRQVAQPRLRRWGVALLLLVGTLLVHPYIMSMAAAVLAAAPLTLLLRRDRRWRAAALCFAVAIVLLGTAAFLLGYGGTSPAAGFGDYAMNLFAPFVPSHASLFPGQTDDAIGGDLESYQYLGAGLLLLCAVAAVQAIRLRTGWQTHAGLVLVLAALTVFSLSNIVHVGHHQFQYIRDVPVFIQQFRATGRFFWPVSYVLLIASLAVVTRTLPRPAAALVLVAAVGLQLADTRGLRFGDRSRAHDIPTWAIDVATLAPIFAAHDRLTLWPTFSCGAILSANDPTFMQLLLLGSQTLMRTNTIYAARTVGALDCNAAGTLSAPLAAGELRVLMPPAQPGNIFLVPDSDHLCHQAGPLVLCTRQMLPLPPPTIPVTPFGTELSVTDAAGRSALAEGWSVFGPDGIWTEGPEAALRMRLPPGAGPVTLTVNASGFAPVAGGVQTVQVLANGAPVAVWTLQDGHTETLQARLPAGTPMMVQLQIAHPHPADGSPHEPRHAQPRLPTPQLPAGSGLTPTLSIVVPCFNEAEGLAAFHARLAATMAGIGDPWEVVYVDDGSSDGTRAVQEALAAADPCVAVLGLSRNFGKEAATTAGLDHARGDAVVVIDADLQDPPEVIADLVAVWRQGVDVVYAQRRVREGETWLKRVTALGFYRLMRDIGQVRLPPNTGDFRLMSRRAVDALGTLRERHRFMKGLFAWVGFPSQAVLYDRAPRHAGASKWNYWKLWNFAIEGITGFTVMPLKVATYIGLVVALFAVTYGTIIVVRTLLYGTVVPGYPSLLAVILFLGGAQLITLGVIGEYLGRVFNETKQRPLYLVERFRPAAPPALPDPD
ncbi:MAG: glycosyltransferase [Acetobacteraceae bacterium]